MRAYPLDDDNAGVVRDHYFHSVAITLHVEDDTVSRQESCGCMAGLDVVGRVPLRRTGIREPVFDPVKAVGVNTAEFMEFFASDDPHGPIPVLGIGIVS